jgi:hypothetical protein
MNEQRIETLYGETMKYFHVLELTISTGMTCSRRKPQCESFSSFPDKFHAAILSACESADHYSRAGQSAKAQREGVHLINIASTE